MQVLIFTCTIVIHFWVNFCAICSLLLPEWYIWIDIIKNKHESRTNYFKTWGTSFGTIHGVSFLYLIPQVLHMPTRWWRSPCCTVTIFKFASNFLHRHELRCGFDILELWTDAVCFTITLSYAWGNRSNMSWCLVHILRDFVRLHDYP